MKGLFFASYKKIYSVNLKLQTVSALPEVELPADDIELGTGQIVF
jgi:hypothetical protein